jgi:hypothetical protein
MGELKLLNAKENAKRFKSLHPAQVTAAHAEHEGKHQVEVSIRAEDVYSIGYTVLSLRLSRDEARALGERLIAESSKS